MSPFRVLVLLAAVLLSATLIPAASAPAARAQQQVCFPGVPGVDACIDPSFAAYWRGNGGLPVFGYPLGPLEQITPPGASAPLPAQWTERNRLEQHPENRPPYNVLIGRVGAERLAQLGRDPAAAGREAGPQPGCLWFEETGHNVCDQGAGVGFKSYWEGNGLRIGGLSRYQQSLALFGLPLTAASAEPGPDGTLIQTQWFERARFEWHPDKPDEYKVLLGLLGRELRAGPPAPAPGAVVPAPHFGVEVNAGFVGAIQSRLVELGGGGIVRYNGLDWSVVEPRKGQRNWATVAAMEGELAAISAAGGEPALIIRGAPGWAMRERGRECGPIRPDSLDEFATFVSEAVQRYSKPPFNVRYWELGNEPDAPFQLITGNSAFGCWGDERDPDYGGGVYGEMLKVVYPVIKAADPNAVVMNGGLLIDCDYRDAGCASGRFFEGMLRVGAGTALDIVAFHAYAYWVPKRMDFDMTSTKWETRGGSFFGKAAMLREVMGRYALDKPLFMNEGALLCYRSNPSCAPQGFYEDAARYIPRLYARTYAAGLYGSSWYTLNGPGWQEAGLLDQSQQPRPAYITFRFIRELLDGASYEGPVGSPPVEGYVFRKGNVRYQILWTNDGSVVELPAAAGTRAIYTVAGERRSPGAALAVGFDPLIVEIAATP